MNGLHKFSTVEPTPAFREEIKKVIHNVLATMLNNSEKVMVSYEVGERTTVFKIDCDPSDYGQLLGKQGRNIEGIRRITIAMMAKFGYRAIVEVPYVKKAREED